MENGGARDCGPVTLAPAVLHDFKTKIQRDGRVESAVQLVCTNPGCTVTEWMDVGDWEARLSSAQHHQQQRGWNGDEDDWRRDHVGEQLACPCGRGWRRRATMPSVSSPAALAAWIDRLQQLRQMRRSEPMLASDAGGQPHSCVDWSRPYLYPVDSERAGLWVSKPAMVQPQYAFCPQTISSERFRPEHPVASTRQRVFSEPETANLCVTGGTNGYQRQMVRPLNGYNKLHTAQSSALNLNADQFAAVTSRPSGDVQGLRGQVYTGQESGSGSHRGMTGLTPRRPSKSDLQTHALQSSANGDISDGSSRRLPADSSRRDGASPDSMSSDSGSCTSSAASTVSATAARRKLSSASTSAAGLAGTTAVCSRGSIFCQRTPTELATFRSLTVHCNAYEIQTSGDDAPYGKDRLRTHVLVALSAARRATVDCVICSTELVVYHDFPLLDGLFFESPMRYNSDIRVEPLTVGGLHRQPLSDSAKFYLNAVCFHCLQGKTSLKCRACGTPWNGSLFVVGNVYLYDVFAAMPCCDARYLCRRCGKPACDNDAKPCYYSDGSRQVRCRHCRVLDHHYVKPLDMLFTRVAKATGGHPHAR